MDYLTKLTLLPYSIVNTSGINIIIFTIMYCIFLVFTEVGSNSYNIVLCTSTTLYIPVLYSYTTVLYTLKKYILSKINLVNLTSIFFLDFRKVGNESSLSEFDLIRISSH
jgi:hypothetical protein